MLLSDGFLDKIEHSIVLSPDARFVLSGGVEYLLDLICNQNNHFICFIQLMTSLMGTNSNSRVSFSAGTCEGSFSRVPITFEIFSKTVLKPVSLSLVSGIMSVNIGLTFRSTLFSIDIR